MNDMYISRKQGHHVCWVLGLAIKIMGMQNISSILVCTIKQVEKNPQCLVSNVYCLIRKICIKEIIRWKVVNTKEDSISSQEIILMKK